MSERVHPVDSIGNPKPRWCHCKECHTKFWMNLEDEMVCPNCGVLHCPNCLKSCKGAKGRHSECPEYKSDSLNCPHCNYLVYDYEYL